MARLKAVRHEDRLTLVEHLDELRSRLIICVAILAVAFGVCAWENQRLLNIINKPLDRETQKNVAVTLELDGDPNGTKLVIGQFGA